MVDLPVSLSPRQRRRSRLFPVVAFALAGSAFIGACSSDDSSSESSSQRPEDVKAPISEVLSKLPTMVDKGNEAKTAAADGDFDKVSSEFDELHEVWEDVEGTVKDRDADIYEQIETAQGLIKDGAENQNAQRVATGADNQAAAVSQFVDAN